MNKKKVNPIYQKSTTVGQWPATDDKPAWNIWAVLALLIIVYGVAILTPLKPESIYYYLILSIGFLLGPVAYITLIKKAPITVLGWTSRNLKFALRDGVVASFMWLLVISPALLLMNIRLNSFISGLVSPGTILAALVISLGEETFFRGFLYPPLRQKWGNEVGSISAAGLFYLLHFDFNGFPITFFYGLIFIYLYRNNNSLVAPAMLHFVISLFIGPRF